jgi:hypothetical protein
VAVHQNGQTAMRKEVADSNLYECQPPLFSWLSVHYDVQPPLSRLKPWRGGCAHHSGQAATSSTSYEKRGTKWERWLAFIEVRVSHEKRGGCHS